MITLRMDAPGTFGMPLLEHASGATLLVQTDLDYPGIAGTFGWSLSSVQPDPAERPDWTPCPHAGTDGTIACPDCGAAALVFIQEAAAWLDAHDGATADDPGYFAE
jgi:hypothetical protein